MIRNILLSTVVLAAFAAPTFAATAATDFYVAQDAKSHLCMVSDTKPDGKMAMDAGTKAYKTKAAAEQAMAALKACAKDAMAKPAAPAAAVVKPAAPAAAAVVKPAAPAAAASTMAAGTFYVEQDAKSHKCLVDDKKPDGKTMMDVGTKVYKTKGRAEQAMGMLKVCKG